MQLIVHYFVEKLKGFWKALWFLKEILRNIFVGNIRWGEVLNQIYEQGLQSVMIVALTSFATGLVLALQSYIVMVRFGAKEVIAQVVVWSLVREMSPVFTGIVFSAKAGAKITAELGSMSVNDQILATRTLGVDPIEFLVVPRFLACCFVLPILCIISEIVGVAGGYLIGVFEAGIQGQYYINQTFKAVRFIDFIGGFSKIFFFAVLMGWTFCYQGFITKGGSIGVGKYTTQAVAYSIILIIVSDTILTKIIVALWG